MNYNIQKIEKPITDVKTVFVYFNGKFPKRVFPIKDTDLPRRLFPCANRFIIKCKACDDNLFYFSKLYSGKNALGEDIKTQFVSDNFDNWAGAARHTDAMYMPWISYCQYKNRLTDPVIAFHRAILLYKKPIYLFINDPLLGSFRPIQNWFKEDLANRWKDDRYRYLKQIPEDYSHVHFMPNDTPFEKAGKGYWWEGKVKELCEKYPDSIISPLSDLIIYDLPTGEKATNLKELPNWESRRGIWCGTCFDSREAYLNSTFVTPGLLKMDIMGRCTEKVNLYTDKTLEDTNIDNTKLPGILREHAYSIYFSRGKFTNMLGATFYEPILHGLPQFIAEKVDPFHEIFPDIPECYFNTEHELKEKTESLDLRDIWTRQANHLFNK